MQFHSRRDILKAGVAAVSGSTVGTVAVPGNAGAAERSGSDYNYGHSIDFGEQYYIRMKEIMERIRRNEMEHIGAISDRMAEALRRGGNVWMQAQAGLMGYIEAEEGHKGNPRILKSSTVFNGGDYDKMKNGDVLLSNYVLEEIHAARDRGVYVVGVPTCYVDSEWTPRGYIQPNPNGWLMGDVTNDILQSYIPYQQGLVDCPEVPEMRICPSAANALNSIFWMFQAEVANKLRDGKAKPVDKSVIYLDTVLDRIQEAYSRQKEYIFDHAPTVAKMIGRGGHYHVTSDHGSVANEATGTAMGPMMTNAFRGDMKKGDVHLLATIEPDSEKIVTEAKKAREMGMFVVSIAPANSVMLRRYSDVFIDNLSPEGGGLFKIKGFTEKVAVAGSILNNWLMWIFTAQFIDEMVRRGWVPWFYINGHVVGAGNYNTAMKPFFLGQGF